MPRYPLSRLVGPMMVWLATLLAGAGMGLWLGYPLEVVGPIAAILCVPALLTLLVSGLANRDWVQGLVLLIWAGFAVVVSLLGGLNLLLVTFLCVPAVGMLFFRGRVLEGLALGALALVATVLGAAYLGTLPQPLGELGRNLLMVLGTAATLALLVAGMVAGTDARSPTAYARSRTRTRWREGVAGGLFEFDAEQRLVAANAQGRAQFGLDAMTGRPTLGELAGDAAAGDLLLNTANTARERRAVSEARVRLGPLDADVAAVDARFTPLADGGLLMHTIDRTDEEVRLEALRRSQTVAEREAEDKTLFFAGVSHELRTPLNAIIGFSDMMRSRLFGPLPGKYAEYADLIHDSGQYMLDLIGDVLDLSKVEAGRYTLSYDTFDASDVIRSSVKMIRPASDAAEVSVDVSMPVDDPLLLTADRKAVRQILLNLLSNAVKFSPKGGRVVVDAQTGEHTLDIAVSDQGPGMSEAELARIGEPFVQGTAGLSTDVRGSGLGLSLVRQLAELHSGTLQMDSAPGRGTTARVSLPLSHTA